MSTLTQRSNTSQGTPTYPGQSTVIHGNGAVAHVMDYVCGGVIGYPITPSTEISELYEAFRAQGGCNVWGQHPFFFEPEGEHSAQSGALGAALTGGKYISNASSSQGILYALESHYVTVGKKTAGFVLHVAARSVSRHSLNVMAGHDDVYALLSAGYTTLFASNAQEAADLAAISYRVSAQSLIPVANTMDGFATSHIQSEVKLPEPELLKQYLGDPTDRIVAPTEAQRMLYGAKGRVWQLGQFIDKYQDQFWPEKLRDLQGYIASKSDEIEKDSEGQLIDSTNTYLPDGLQKKWQRAWLNAYEKDTRQRVPALVDTHNPGLTGGVQNQPDYQAGIVDHRSHFQNDVPQFIEQAMQEYGELTGRFYEPVMDFMCDDADYVIVGLGSVTDDAEAVAAHLRKQGQKVGVISIKQLHPFPEAQIVEKLAGKLAVTVLERCDETRLTARISRALFKAQENVQKIRHQGIKPLQHIPMVNTGIFGLGGHDLQPNHLIAAFDNMREENTKPFFYLGSQFFDAKATGELKLIQDRLREAYPDTELMALETGENPNLLPESAMRVRFHSVGGYGTIATGKLLTDILSGALGLHSKSMPKYGSEKSGAPTNFFITLSPEPIKITNAELQQVEIVLSPDHKVFMHTNPLAGLTRNGTFILQTHHEPEQVWHEIPASARQFIRENNINFYIVDAFKVAREQAPSADLEIRMMGIAFIGALCGHATQVTQGADESSMLERITQQIAKKFGAKGKRVVDSNMAVIREGIHATQQVCYADFNDVEVEATAALTSETPKQKQASCGLFDPSYFSNIAGQHYADGTIGEAPVIPGSGMFMPPASAITKDKGLFRLNAPKFDADKCTGCMECTIACPDGAIPNAVHELHDILYVAIDKLNIPPMQRDGLKAKMPPILDAVRQYYRTAPKNESLPLHQVVANVVDTMTFDDPAVTQQMAGICVTLESLPVSRTKPFFDAMEKAVPGSGGLFSVAIDPSKCSGCMECVDVCGPNALQKVRQTTEMNQQMHELFTTLADMPNTPARFLQQGITDASESKRLLLDRSNYYAMSSGHGACRGCGEVTALRLATSINRALQQQRYQSHIASLEDMIEKLEDKCESLVNIEAEQPRAERIARTLKVLEKRLFHFEHGPTGNGPSDALIANATGCSSVYASTFPANPYNDPWVNSLFQDTPAVAKGLFEGEAANQLEQFKALRAAKLELEDMYDAKVHDSQLRYLEWSQLSDQELGLLPTVFSIGGDGATYDIGFGALSRLLSTSTPIKVLVLNTGSYSNTGGQASTSSFTAQDSDLSRFGSAHSGKQESRKELGIIATFHPKVMVVQTSTALQGHFMSNLMEYLNYQDAPALFDVYTPCMGEHGIADDASTRHSRLAVESRMSPVFVHDPRKGETLSERFCIEGNPELQQDWATHTISYIDNDGMTQLKQVPFTPADFSLYEGRFKKHFSPVTEDHHAIEVAEYVAMSADERNGKTPFIWATDKQQHLIKLQVSSSIVALTEERLRNWHMLQYLSGQHVTNIDQQYQRQINEWKQRYQSAMDSNEQTIESIANGLAELAMAASPNVTNAIPVTQIESGSTAPQASSHADGALPLVVINEDDKGQCTDCKTCYQQLGELFEKTTIVDNGEAKIISQVIPNALETVQLSDEIVKRASRIADECDAEIIHFNAPASVEV
ncbi:2-oxoacid:acceptor oxidoreductase family protein [Photobacterium sp. DNB23_23_1]|uniref:2-oxoacid:acceptor oxidoreductase family protein n=1 Tax=Photobacterium pectinilyticum TaxID=2906793 RepID=A0ABT1MZQ6_9GAMM|nr:2-oxoacid:acceptor oxidoreductase family protein [Photobacterium sp. ZSDE20]MCQ1057997.1 2-oxoacid:acceptor oxidoreductase family protein [Photobacterium sp. ZSDE20]MDD1822530.1 2-oxoacid:acceptor oxidoreductase family protein [Photobacterium sp. ZSDE20]